MFISNLELIKDPSLAARMKSWVGSLNLAAKEPSQGSFKLASSCTLKVRMRRSTAGVGPLTNYTFGGSERFLLGSVVLEKNMEREGYSIRAIFQPDGVKLAGEIMSLALPLDEAIDTFEGLDEWVDVSVIETTAVQREKAEEEAAVAHLPTVEATRASETWGAW